MILFNTYVRSTSIERGVASCRIASRRAVRDRVNLLDDGFVYIYSWLGYQLIVHDGIVA